MDEQRPSYRLQAFMRRHRSVLLGCLYTTVFGLGVVGWMQTAPTLGVIDSAYRSLGLFLMASGGEANPAPLLNVARFAAPILAASTVVAVALRVLATQRTLARALRLKGATLVIGDGPVAMEAVRSFNVSGAPVLFIGTGPDDLLVPLRKSGVVQLDAVDDPTLGKLMQRSGMAIVASETDTATASKAKRLRRVRGESIAVAHVLFEDPSLVTTWRRDRYEKIVGIPDQIATTLLRKVPPTPSRAVAPPPLVIGEGPVASAVLRRIITAWQSPGERIEIHAAGSDRAWADDAVAGIEGRVNLRWHTVGRHPVYAVRLIRRIHEEWPPPDRPERHDIVGSRVYVAFDEESVAAPLALAIAKQTSRTRVACLVDDAALWYRDPEAVGLEYLSRRGLVVDPGALGRSAKDDVADEIRQISLTWPEYDDSPDEVLLRVDGSGPGSDVAQVVSASIEQLFHEAGLRIKWTAGIEGSGFVAAPEQLDSLAKGVLSRVGVSADTDDPLARDAALAIAAHLPTAVARVGGRTEAQHTPPLDATQIEQLAQVFHARYVASATVRGNATGSANATRRWEELPEFEKRSNSAQAVDIPLKLARVGLSMRNAVRPRLYVFADDEIEILAQHEHRRWVHFQTRNGRTDNKLNVPWLELMEKVRDYDRDAVLAIPGLLAALGIEITPLSGAPSPPGHWVESLYPHPDGDEYARIGTAWAWPLDREFVWETPRGDMLRGAAGDWWVVTEDGTTRTVSPETFEASYEPQGGQVYRRKGRIRGRQVDTPELVETLEGPARAERKDWVATSPRGDRWPITAERFAELYQAVSAVAAAPRGRMTGAQIERESDAG